jgi:hypothetical protein
VKRFILLAAALAALTTAAVAVAQRTTADVNQVNATFAATTPSHLQTRTLSCAGGQTVEVATARYTGTATSATSDLSGPVRLRVYSVYNTTRKLGWVEGSLVVGASDNRTIATFSAVNSDGKLDGWLRGSAGHRDGRLVGSFTASFTPNGGLSAGQFGTGTSTNGALLIKSAGCRLASNPNPNTQSPRPSIHLTVRGQVDALSATAISVKPSDGGASQSCTIGQRKPGRRIEMGDRVVMTCALSGSTWMLTGITERR